MALPGQWWWASRCPWGQDAENSSEEAGHTGADWPPPEPISASISQAVPVRGGARGGPGSLSGRWPGVQGGLLPPLSLQPFLEPNTSPSHPLPEEVLHLALRRHRDRNPKNEKVQPAHLTGAADTHFLLFLIEKNPGRDHVTCPILFPSSSYYGLLRRLVPSSSRLKIQEREGAPAPSRGIDWVGSRLSHLHPLLRGGRRNKKGDGLGNHWEKNHLA